MRRISGFLALLLVAAVAACADSAAPDVESMAPEMSLNLEAVAPTVAALQAANTAERTDEADGLELAFATTPTVYDFEDLPVACVYNNILPNPYLDLTFTNTPYIGVCNTGGAPYPDGNFLIPAYYAGSSIDPYLVTEHTIELPETAASVTVVDGMWYNAFDQSPSVEAHDGSGNLVGTMEWTDAGILETQTVTGSIASITIVSQQAAFAIGDLSIEYGNDPETKDDCKKGGWEDYGFRNQGQCVRYIETGKDSR